MTKKAKILVAEDDPSSLEFLTNLLCYSGYAVIEAVSGEQALDKMKSGKPDLLISDILMPGMDGFELAQKIRTDPALSQIPILFYSATYNEKQATWLAEACGVTQQLSKPADPEVILHAVEKALRAPAKSLRLDPYILAEEHMRLLSDKIAAKVEELENNQRRLQAEVTRRETIERELLQRQQEYRSIIQGAPYGIYRANHDGNVLMANPALAAMLGYESENDILQLNTARDIFVDPAERARALSAVVNNIASSEHQWRRKDGKEITVRIAGRKLPGETGAAAIYEVFVQDITAQRILEQEFLQAQKMEVIGRVAGGVAHDFNNMLMIVSGCLDLLQHEKGDARRREKYIQQIRDATTMAASITRQLLGFSRKQMVERQVLDVNSILKDMTKMLPRLLGTDVEVVMIPGRQLERVLVDRGQVEQVLMNLAVNARDAMPKGGKLIIETSNLDVGDGEAEKMQLAPGRYASISVTDTGVGMDAQTQKRIFEPFFTTKERGKGTGLGLSTVATIVKDNKGHINLHSNPGRGSTFEILFPAARASEAVASAVEPVITIERGTETILLVEDEATLRAVTFEYLQSIGYKVLPTSNGSEAIDMCRSYPNAIHLLLSDVVMPGMSGPEVATAAAAIRPELKIIYVSGYVDRQIDLEVLEAGSTFLQKPYSMEDLSRKIREVLSRRSIPPGPPRLDQHV
jgi:PAS domain S-box-containing protein